MLGLDPYSVIDQGREDQVIRTALMQKAFSLKAERTSKEYEALANRISYELAKILVRIL